MLCIHTIFVPIQPQTTLKTSKSIPYQLFSCQYAKYFEFFYSKKTVQLIESKKDLCCELVASWSVQVGDLDQCLHLWRFTGGFEKVDLAEKVMKTDPVSKVNPLSSRRFLKFCHFRISLNWQLSAEVY